ncbi:hypothetical protein K504DRAFT_333623, partial [Pleomassaria siparia CBS 279.74]
ESSPELGSPSLRQQYNRKTGRPIRRSAGRLSNIVGYVDSGIIEDDADLPSEDNDEEVVKTKRIKKRRRTPSLTPPPLDKIIYDELADLPSDDEDSIHNSAAAAMAPITLQFNVPLGFHGPLVVKLDRSLTMSLEGARDMRPRKLRRRNRVVTPKAQPKEQAVSVHKTGFCDLPPELRNKVYRHVLVADDGFQLPTGKILSRSAQFLRTCRLVHSEGCSILYGENNFSFDRNRTTRGPLWEPVPKEIGYKDARMFLKMIGPENLAYLRDVKLVLEDANPASTPYISSHEDRRYLNDEHLIDFLRILSQAKLRKFSLSFLGRRALSRTDAKFVGYLERVKADEITSSPFVRFYYSNKIHNSLWEDMKVKMTRKTKLYAQQ